MKRLLTQIFLTLVLMGGGCTQNNGYIGPVFGSWALVGISEAGSPLPLTDETVFSFQNEVVQVEQIKSEFDRVVRYGNFTISDDVMTMRFMTELNADMKGYEFLMPTWLYFPTNEMPLVFDVVKLKGNTMILELGNAGLIYTYTFRKTW